MGCNSIREGRHRWRWPHSWMPLGVDVIRFARNLRSDWPAGIVTGCADADAISHRPPNVPLPGSRSANKGLIESISIAHAGPQPIN